MPLTNKNNQSVVCGRDYKAVPGEDPSPQSPSSPNTTPKSDLESAGVASETELVNEKEEKQSRRKSRNTSNAFTTGRLSKVAKAEADADQQLLRVSVLEKDPDENRNEKNQLQIDLENAIWNSATFGLPLKSTPPVDRKSISHKSIRVHSSRSRRCLASLCSRSMWRKRAKNFIPILLFMVYSASGGLMFWLLEGRGRQAKADQEKAVRVMKQNQIRNATVMRLVDLIQKSHQEHVTDRMDTYNYSTIDVYTDMLHAYYSFHLNSTNSTNFTSPANSSSNETVPLFDLRHYVDSVVDALNHSFLFLDVWTLDHILVNFTSTMTPLLDEHDRRDWTFWGSIFYCGTIYTTIGYGYMTANTDLGRALTIVYALFGIPLVLYNLSQLGRLLMGWIWKMYIGLLKLINMCKLARYRETRGFERQREIAEFPFWIAISLTLGWTLMCSAIFWKLENWDFFTSFYFFFQSLTTIGFGDVKPNHPEYLVWSFFLILIGLALVSMCWSLLQIKFDHLINEATKKIAEQFVNTEMDDAQMATDVAAIENEIHKITSGENSLLASMVSDNRRQGLMNEWRKKAKMVNRGCQATVNQEEKSLQTIHQYRHSSSQTPGEMDTSGVSTHWDVPYRETRRPTTSRSAHSTPYRQYRESNDEFKNLLKGLKTILGECQETLSSKDLTSAVPGSPHTIMGVTLTPVRQSRGGRRLTSARSVSPSSTIPSTDMLEL